MIFGTWFSVQRGSSAENGLRPPARHRGRRFVAGVAIHAVAPPSSSASTTISSIAIGTSDSG